jgi:hypothetical protein
VVTPVAADYHLPMSVAENPNDYRLVERDGPAGRRVLERRAADGRELLVIARCRGGAWPDRLSDAILRPQASDGRWRLTSTEGSFEFETSGIDRVSLRPGLYGPLHERFALNAWDRLAIRVLLAFLRLPGGAKLLRRWHSRRNA